MAIQEWLTFKEMSDFIDLTKHNSSIIRRAKREGWTMRQRAGVKGVTFEYLVSDLPSDIRETIVQHQFKNILNTPTTIEPKAKELKPSKYESKSKQALSMFKQSPVILENHISELNDSQKRIADARIALVSEVLKLESVNVKRLPAIKIISDKSRDGTLPEHIQAHVEIANAKKGNRVGVSVRSLQQWVLDYCRTNNPIERLALLAPGVQKPKKAEEFAWLVDFLAFYRNPNGVSMSDAYRAFSEAWCAKYPIDPPSYSVVKTVMKRVPTVEKQRYRKTAAAYLSLNPFVRRDWEQLPVNSVWIGDGHNLKMLVAHPIHGRPFSPEVTFIMDGRTRTAVGWSLSLSESTIAVADALRHAMQHHGVPLIYYSDNGSGQTNKQFDADITGILPRMGVHHETGIPGNPQGRGIIERFNQTAEVIAQKFPTYRGKHADSDTVRIVGRSINSAINAFEKGAELSTQQRNALDKLPSWEQLIDAIELEVNRYNSREHSSLPKKPNGKHYSPIEYREFLIATEKTEIQYVTSLELREMFMPSEIRKVARGEVRLFNNIYFSLKLADYHEQDVMVSFDIHNPNAVIVRDMQGHFICEAVWNGNKVAAFPVAFVEKKQQERVAGIVKRKQAQIEEAQRELNPVIEYKESDSLFGALMTDEPQQVKEPVFIFETDRDEYLNNLKKVKGV